MLVNTSASLIFGILMSELRMSELVEPHLVMCQNMSLRIQERYSDTVSKGQGPNVKKQLEIQRCYDPNGH